MSAEQHLKVEWWPIERAIPYVRNPRKLAPGAVAKVAASLKEFGWRQPLVVDQDGVVIVGHTRLLAAQRLGQEQVPVHIACGLTAAQAKAYRIADNRTAAENDWDLELLPLELDELVALDCDLGLLGFEAQELASLRPAQASAGLADPDEVPGPPACPVVPR
jgi:ParB-like chromosome segregation protein Spo0J